MSADIDIERAIELLRGAGRPFSLSVVGPDGDLYTWEGHAPPPSPEAAEPVTLFDLEVDRENVSWRGAADADLESAPKDEVTVIPAWDGSRVRVALGCFNAGRLTVTQIPCEACQGSGLGPEAEVLDDLVALGAGGATQCICPRCGGTGAWTAAPPELCAQRVARGEE